MTTIHLIYPHGNYISCPHAIGRKLEERLSKKYKVILYNWDEVRIIRPTSGDDVLLGHSHPLPWTIFNRSSRLPGWKRVLLMCPYSHGDRNLSDFMDPAIRRSDRYLAITGRYWFNSVSQSPYAAWAPKMIHLDLAVDRNDFPFLKSSFNPPGKRKFVYIGNNNWCKNPRFLSAIAAAMPEAQIDWLGGTKGIPGLNGKGRINFASDSGKQLIQQYDFLLAVSSSDANPTTILESAAWGLIPICTPQCGYVDYPSITNVPLNDLPGTLAVLRRLQQAPESELKALQAANLKMLDDYFNWDRFVKVVEDAIESTDSPSCLPMTLGQRLAMRYHAVFTPGSFWRPIPLARHLFRTAMGRKNT